VRRPPRLLPALVLSIVPLVAAPLRVDAAASVGYETRAEFVYNLDRALGVQPVDPGTPDFIDVPPTSPYYGYVEAAYRNGWIDGVGQGRFGPGGPLTRAAVAKIEVLALGKGAEAASLEDTLPAFKDAGAIPAWAVGYVNEAVALGLLRGESGGLFDPGGDLTVAQEAYVLSQLLAYKESQPSVTGLLSSAPAEVSAGVPFSVLLVAQGDAAYQGTDTLRVSIGEPDAGAVLPTEASFSDGVATVTVTLTKAEPNTITIHDETLGFSTAVSLTVLADTTPAKLAVVGPPTATVGSPFDVTLLLEDAYQNTVTYTGPASVLVTVVGDPGASVPTTAAFTDGVAVVSITPSAAGDDPIVVTVDEGGTSVTGESAAIAVQEPPNTIAVSSADLSAGGPISASISGGSQHVSWSLVATNGYTYPLFGSTNSVLSETIPIDIVQGVYTLRAIDLDAGVTYQRTVNVSSNYPFSLAAITPSLVYNWQDMTPLFDEDILGQGETIALYEENGFLMSDIQRFDAAFGLPDPNISVLAPGGQAQPVDTSAMPGASYGTEAAMDIEWAHALAPLANIVVYEYPSDTDFGAYVGQVAEDAASRAYTALSFSFCVQGDDPTGGWADGRLMAAADNGLAIFASSGDHGLEAPGSTCWPSANPDVVSVGGIQYNESSASYWYSGYDPNSGVLWSGGYGVADYTAPPWQAALGYGAYRLLPDVSLLAENAVMVFDGQVYTSSGTSLASPCWAAIWALADQAYRTANGSGIPGPAPEAIYAVAADAQGAPAFFQDAGTAAPFYSGVGFASPDAAAFVRDILWTR
jgi:hypothetical protein